MPVGWPQTYTELESDIFRCVSVRMLITTAGLARLTVAMLRCLAIGVGSGEN